MGGGAVVAFEPDHLGAGEVALVAQDVVHFGAAPAVDRLVVVADAADVVRALGQKTQPQILDDVGVLILVDQDEAEPLVIVSEYVRVLAQQRHRLEQQVAEVDGVQNLEARLIGGVELAPATVDIGACLALGDLGRPQTLVLPAIESGGELAGRPALLVDAVGLDQLLDQAQLVVGVENGEVALQADEFGMFAQHANADRVEGAEPGHALDDAADQLADAFLHLARRLVGEGHREDLRGKGAARRQNVGDAGGQHARLAGAGAGQHQHRAVQCFDRLALLGVHAAEIADGAARAGGGHGAGGDAQRGGGVEIGVVVILGSSHDENNKATGRRGRECRGRGKRPSRG